MIFHENRLADDSYEIVIPYYFRKLRKMSHNLLSAAVKIGALRVKLETIPILMLKLARTCTGHIAS